MYMKDYSQRVFRMKDNFINAKSQSDKNKIVQDFVDELRAEGISDEDIKKVLNIELCLESQGNRIMISNDKTYQDAVRKALGKE
ncbi:hypothetical protein QJU89_02365 [Pasteurella skyensis]|uniref:Uncharacterized protein n=1 Tax=Phocoenobacter skyensis TaxID=97481 RepID=A0AAJ6N8Q8_9PAST|nr:hypothetical protein [Pasteurella skyensis]MDP8162382.1 hypothetical protein [Pasteurella skyensis]MDP8172284.1 hypothetical protein [Pasteurella skyensis]MDP8178539.1 hypothetical protein [Pasteurella skyensis]MDP8182541.1 hypothetical protein [Pasteurella skyensis]MDP8188846.1 hypothetical protein [Pasteurella skyensis]